MRTLLRLNVTLKSLKKIAFVSLVVFFVQLYIYHIKLSELNISSAPKQSQPLLQCDHFTFSNSTKSAIDRARSISCKQLIGNVSCSYRNGNLYATRLPNQCPYESVDAILREIHFHGCFRANSSTFRDSYLHQIKHSNPVRSCWKFCHQHFYHYAAVYLKFIFWLLQKKKKKRNETKERIQFEKKPHEQVRETVTESNCDRNKSVAVYNSGISQKSLASRRYKARIVFLLTVTGRAIRQIKRLINAIYRIEHYFYVHVDSREDYLFRQLLPLEKQLKNFKLARKRYSTIWGGSSLLTMLLHAMKTVSREFAWTEWDYVMNLSETDYPIKRIDELSLFLGTNLNRNYLKEHAIELNQFVRRQGLRHLFVECDNHMWRIGNRTLPENVRVTGGSDWFVLSKQFVRFLIDDKRKNDLVDGFLRFFQFSLLPAESFFHSVLFASPFCHSFIDNNLRLINWKRKTGCRCQYRKIVDWCGCSPNVFKFANDWEQLQKTHNKSLFFARKFEPVIDQTILKEIDRYLLFRNTSGHEETEDDYWENIYHYEDMSPETNEALLYLGKLVIVKQVTEMNCKSNISGKLTEIHMWFRNDRFRGFLVKYSLNMSAIQFESLVTIRDRTHEHFYVTSSYDEKESISRNFLRLLDQNSDLILVHNLTGDLFKCDLFLVQVYDPNGRQISTFNLNVTENRQFTKLLPDTFRSRPIGKWTVTLSSGSLRLTNFFWIFSAYFQQPIFTDWKSISEFYSILEHCAISSATNQQKVADFRDSCSFSIPNNCAHTPWSSLYPDHKSILNF